MDICSNVVGSVGFLLGELSGYLINDWKLFENYTMKLGIAENRTHLSISLSATNGKDYTMMLQNMFNRAKSVNEELEFGTKNLYTPRGVLLYGQKSKLM